MSTIANFFSATASHLLPQAGARMRTDREPACGMQALMSQRESKAGCKKQRRTTRKRPRGDVLAPAKAPVQNYCSNPNLVALGYARPSRRGLRLLLMVCPPIHESHENASAHHVAQRGGGDVVEDPPNVQTGYVGVGRLYNPRRLDRETHG